MQTGLYIVIFILGIYAGSVIENKIISKDIVNLINRLDKSIENNKRYIKFLEDTK